MAKISWLHISDTHILRLTDTKGAEAYNQKQVLERFIDFMENHFPEDKITRPQCLFITGDLAFTGKKRDYQGTEKNPYCVKTMIDEIACVMGIKKDQYRDRIFSVPGNHDIDRDSLKDADIEKAILETARDNDKLNNFFLSVEKDKKCRRKQILARSTAYCNFVRDLWNDTSPSDEEILWYARPVPISGSTPCYVVGLNSAWLCHSYWFTQMKGTNEEKTGEPVAHLTLCESLVDKAIKSLPSDALTVALMHHDYELTQDRNSGIQHLLENRCDFILCGHEHDERWATPTLSGAYKIRAGRFYEKRGRRNVVNCVEVDLETGQVKMATIHYRPDKGGFWALDRDCDPTGGQAGYTFDSNTGVLSLRFSSRGGPSTGTRQALPSFAKTGVTEGWRKVLSKAKASIISAIAEIYASSEGDFWLLVDQTDFNKRSFVAGLNLRQRTNSFINLCIYRTKRPVVLDIFEKLVKECPGIAVFSEVLNALRINEDDV